MERKNPFSPLSQAPLPPEGRRPLEVALVRGASVESRHRVHLAIVDEAGAMVRHWGEPELTFFPRSSVKLMQATAWVGRDGFDWKVTGPEELAIACGSHEGEPFHVKVVEGWLKKLGLGEGDLECGAHEPYHRPSVWEMARKGEKPTQVHNACAGNHLGILSCCKAHDWELPGYVNYDHPAQLELRKVLREFFGSDFREDVWGIDGCGIPTYQTTLKGLAAAMSKVATGKGLPPEIRQAVGQLNGAVAAHPLLIGGTESFSSKVVAETEGRVFAKMGSEGVYGLWIPSEGLGIAAKCEDGTVRASEIALSVLLQELGYAVSHSALVQRWSGEVVGQFLCG